MTLESRQTPQGAPGIIGIRRWLMRIPGTIALILVADLVASAGARQAAVALEQRKTLKAELQQEPYRGTDWGRPYWEEIGRYTEKWDPYFVYRVGEMHGRFINVTDGVRKSYEPRASKPTARRRLIFLFGGSAAWGHGARDEYTLPSWLARVAEARGEDLEVRNYAESGWVNWQGIVYLLQKLADGERPDAVVFYSGVNETLSAHLWPQVRRPIWDAELYPSAMRERVLRRNWPLAGVWDYYRNTSFAFSTIWPHPPEFPAAQTETPDQLVDHIAGDYLADVRVVEALGHEYGFSTMFAWQLTVAAKERLSPQERRYAGWLPRSAETSPGVEWWALQPDLHDLYAAIGTSVTSHGRVVDLSHAFSGVSSTAFIDWMHSSESGNEHIARAMYDRLLADSTPRQRSSPNIGLVAEPQAKIAR